ncbi:MAG: DUF1540 domain-containing protein [Oscillospiraceae bacterium]|jgi:hypothetical protein|nr:DUF1540 domain-containing protein [Oscillospiraceae bacterium]
MKNQNPDQINHIKCDAYNCLYNDGTQSCLAESIKVENPTAKKCGDTLCSTFKLDKNTIK